MEQDTPRPTLQGLFDEMVISQAEFGRQAQVSVYTIYNALAGNDLKRLIVQKLLKVINAHFNRHYVYGDIEGLNMEPSRKKQ